MNTYRGILATMCLSLAVVQSSSIWRRRLSLGIARRRLDGCRTGGPARWMITFSSINFETETLVVRGSLCQLFANTDLLHKRGVIPEQIFLGHDTPLVPMPKGRHRQMVSLSRRLNDGAIR